jgi:hypothetical protein
MTKNPLRAPIGAIVLLSVGGALLHARAHPVSFDPADPSNPAMLVPFIGGFLSIIAVPLLLAFKRTFAIGYLLNGMSVVIGTITMATLSLSSRPSPLTVQSIFLGTMIPNIVLLLPKLFIGQTILHHYHPNGMGRLFTASWWTRHFIYLSAVFALGCFLWR